MADDGLLSTLERKSPTLAVSGIFFVSPAIVRLELSFQTDTDEFFNCGCERWLVVVEVKFTLKYMAIMVSVRNKGKDHGTIHSARTEGLLAGRL